MEAIETESSLENEETPGSGEAGELFAFPVSFAQWRLWFLDQLTPGTPAYNLAAAVRLTGRLDVPALAASLREVVRRHEALRTTFGQDDGDPVQLVTSEVRLDLPVLDLRGSGDSHAADLEAWRLSAEEARRPFDLAQGPLLRTLLLRLAENEHSLVLTLHHTVSDGWSLGVLVREVAALYEAFSLGQPSPLPELPIQYADFTLWQRDQLDDPAALEPLVGWWREHLEGAPRTLELPTDHPRGPHPVLNGASREARLPARLSEEVRRLVRSERTTLFVTLLTAFGTLLSRIGGQDDLVVGTPVASRKPPETEGLIGFFANTLALRVNLSGDPTFREALARVGEAAAGAFEHEDLPFERLVEALEPERSLSLSPLFQAMLVLQNTPMPALELPGLALAAEELDNGAAQLDLVLDLKETPDGLAGRWRYDRGLFEAATVDRFQAMFEVLLAAAVADPDARLSRLPLLAEAGRRQILTEWQGASFARPEMTIHQGIAAQAERTPEAVAVVSEEESLTYRELLRRSRELAAHLRGLGVGPETRVGVAVDRSAELVVGLLGVLEAGGAYVPL
ncbi:MAG TPA: condensation domain-containing protein, partial [Thermoanaerobaculia bacterium]|nr:condensation domain-containing protein [Thermoanaerobaculia bacterium]